MMKLRMIIMLLFWLIAQASVKASCPGDSLDDQSLDMVVTKVSDGGAVVVRMRNTSTHDLRIFRESNPWGSGRWRLLIIHGGRLSGFYEYIDKKDLKSETPEYLVLLPGQTTDKFFFALKLFNWHNNDGSKLIFSPGDTIYVIYDVPPSDEVCEMGVWHGFLVTQFSIPEQKNVSAITSSKIK